MKKLVIILALAVSVQAQTLMSPGQIKQEGQAAATAIICTPAGATGPGKCGAFTLSGFVVDEAAGTVKPAPAPASIQYVVEVMKLTTALASYTLAQQPFVNSLVVVRGGSEQTDSATIGDYTLAGRVVTFAAASTPRAGDLVKFRYVVAAPSPVIILGAVK